MASEAQKAVDTTKAAATQAVTAAASEGAAAATAAAAPAAASNQAQGIIDKAKGLVANQKYQDALATLQQLTGLSLTVEQQKIVDGLKAQVQSTLAKATASEATSALGNVLGGKK